MSRMQKRLAAWLTLIGAFIVLAYASRAAEGKPPKDSLYQYGTALSGLVWYAVWLGLILLITHGPCAARAARAAATSRARARGRAGRSA